MANYSTLKSNVASVVRTNGQNAITGANLQTTLYGMIESLGADYQLMGIATASTDPGSNIDQNIAYLAISGSSTVTFTHFLSGAQTPLSLAPNKFGVLRYNGTWSIQSADLPSGGGGSSSPVFIYNPNIDKGVNYGYTGANARNFALQAGYISSSSGFGLLLVYKAGTGSSGTWTVEMYVGGGASAVADASWVTIYPASGGGGVSDVYVNGSSVVNSVSGVAHITLSQAFYNAGAHQTIPSAADAVPTEFRKNGTIITYYDEINSAWEMRMFCPSSFLPYPISAADWLDSGNWIGIFSRQNSQI